MLYCAVLCCAVLCCAVLCCAVLCCAVLCCAVLCCAVLCCAVLCCSVLCCAMLYCAMLCCPCYAVCRLCSFATAAFEDCVFLVSFTLSIRSRNSAHSTSCLAAITTVVFFHPQLRQS